MMNNTKVEPIAFSWSPDGLLTAILFASGKLLCGKHTMNHHQALSCSSVPKRSPLANKKHEKCAKNWSLSVGNCSCLFSV